MAPLVDLHREQTGTSCISDGQPLHTEPSGHALRRPRRFTPRVNALHRTSPHPQPVPSPGGVDQLNVHGGVGPLHRNTVQLCRSRRDVHPRAYRYRGAVRPCGLPSQIYFGRREPDGARGAGDLLGAGGHPLINAIGVATIGTHAATLEHTFDSRIATLDARLGGEAPSSIVDLNRAIAVAFSEGPDAGLALIYALNLDAPLGECRLQHATRADLLRRLVRPTDALPHDRRALELAPSDAESRFLRSRIADCLRPGNSSPDHR